VWFVGYQSGFPGKIMEIKALYALFVRFVVIKILCVYPGITMTGAPGTAAAVLFILFGFTIFLLNPIYLDISYRKNMVKGVRKWEIKNASISSAGTRR
jgi:hypothetical protein